MAVQAYDLDGRGVVLVCTTSDRPINMEVHTFADADEAERFLKWLADRGRDVRTEDEPWQAVQEWRFQGTCLCACGHLRNAHENGGCCDCDGDCTGFEASA